MTSLFMTYSVLIFCDEQHGFVPVDLCMSWLSLSFLMIGQILPVDTIDLDFKKASKNTAVKRLSRIWNTG